MRMIPEDYKKFQPYSYHRQIFFCFFFFEILKIKSLPPNLNFTLSSMGKKEEKLNKRMRKEKKCSPDF